MMMTAVRPSSPLSVAVVARRVPRCIWGEGPPTRGIMMLTDSREWPETVLISGSYDRVPSPYIVLKDKDFWCTPCKVWLQSPEHLKKGTHVNKAWYWCFGCSEHGWRAHAPNVQWPSRLMNPKYWNDSPGSDNIEMQDGQRFAAAAAGSAGPAGQDAQAEGSQTSSAGDGGALQPPPGLEGDPISMQTLHVSLEEIGENLKKINEYGLDQAMPQISGINEQVLRLHEQVAQQTTKIERLEQMMNSMLPRGTLRGRGGDGLSGSVSTGSLPGLPIVAPYAQGFAPST